MAGAFMPRSDWWIWKRRMSSAVAVLGERSRKAAKPETVRM
jgi:hypothetical protein